MAEISRIWQGRTTGDAGLYSSAQWRQLWESVSYNELNSDLAVGYVTGSGVNATTEPLDITQTSPASLAVSVNVGEAWMFGAWYSNDSPATVGIDNNLDVNPRIDSVVLRMDWTAQTIRLAVVKGTNAASPVPPTLTQNIGSTYEYEIARIAVASGAATITNANITKSMNLPLRRVANQVKTTANTNAPSTFSGLWNSNMIKQSAVNAVQYTDNSALFLSADDASNWFEIRKTFNRASQTGQSGTIALTETTIASVSLTVNGRRPVLITGGFAASFSSGGNVVTARVKEGTTTLYTHVSSVVNAAFPYSVSWIYIPAAAGTFTLAVTAQRNTFTTSFDAGYIVAMEL